MMFKRKKKRSREFKKNTQVIDIEQARAERQERRRKLAEKRGGRKSSAASRKAPMSERQTNKRNRKRLIYAGIMLGIAFLVGFSLYQDLSLRHEYKRVVEENKALTLQKERLKEELKNINSPEYIEQQARDQLKLVRPGEVMYILPDKDEEVSKEPAEQVVLPSAGEDAD